LWQLQGLEVNPFSETNRRRTRKANSIDVTVQLQTTNHIWLL